VWLSTKRAYFRQKSIRENKAPRGMNAAAGPAILAEIGAKPPEIGEKLRNMWINSRLRLTHLSGPP
jgi:hypothetical protein